MRVVQVAAELAPVAKVGGMGDVMQGLSRALQKMDVDVAIILPKYKSLPSSGIKHLEVIENDLKVPLYNTWHHNTVWKGDIDSLKVFFIESHDSLGLFEGNSIYGGPHELMRFLYFCRATYEFLSQQTETFDILHLHDWHTAALARLFNPEKTKTVLTLHNLSYPGKCQAHDLQAIGLDTAGFEDPDDPTLCNLLRGGIEYADLVTTVSPTYADEMLRGEESLSPMLREHRKKFMGILNGIDYSYWNPEKDPFLPFHYSLHGVSDQKEKLKNHLRNILSLEKNKKPLVASISRLVEQKGPELIKEALLSTLQRGGQFVLLGSSSEERYQKDFQELKSSLAKNKNVYIELTYNEPLSHLVYAAADLFCVPSHFEPCGLTQLIAMRYGTLPLARQTGGLQDTVVDVDDATAPQRQKNGFLFRELTKEALNQTLSRALDYWEKRPDEWKTLIINSMERDSSWNHSSERYYSLYKRLSARASANEGS